jgi:hypothetical protein
MIHEISLTTIHTKLKVFNRKGFPVGTMTHFFLDFLGNVFLYRCHRYHGFIDQLIGRLAIALDFETEPS